MGPGGNNHKRSTADPHDENTFWNPWMAALLSLDLPGQSVMEVHYCEGVEQMKDITDLI